MANLTEQDIIRWYEQGLPESGTKIKEIKLGLGQILSQLEAGTLRVASLKNKSWQIHDWIKKAILLYFKTHASEVMPLGPTQFFDKVPLQFNEHSLADFQASNIRVVPFATVRRGAYIGPNCVLMPCFVNIGAYIDSGCMLDTWSTVGACAQIGRNVHLSGGAGIGGVLEPLQAQPTIIEDNCFIGARSEIVEGVIVEENSVISMGVFIGQSTKIYNRATGEITYGRVPRGSVVVPGSLPNQGCHLNCAVIVKTIDAKTRAKVAINAILREAVSA